MADSGGIVPALEAVLGADGVATGADIGRWSRDWTGQLAWRPLCVARPRDTEGVSAALRVARQAGVAVVPVGGNTGLAGGTVAEGAMMLSLDRMNRVREIRPGARIAVVEAGVVLDALHAAAAEQGLRFPVSFGARGSATLGGMISTNAGGSGVLRHGNTRERVLGLEAVLPDGSVLDLMGALHKDNSGYALKHLMIGAEGTLGIVTAAVLSLTTEPAGGVTAMAAMRDLDAALDLLNRLRAMGIGAVEAFEFMDRRYMRSHAEHDPAAPRSFEGEHDVTILFEVSSDDPASVAPDASGGSALQDAVETVLAGCLEAGTALDAVVARSEAQRRAMWARREAAAEVTVARKPVVICDIAVPVDRVGAFLDDMLERLPAIDPGAEPMAIAHLGDGNVHYSVWPRDAGAKDAIVEAVEGAVAVQSGTFSAEHGIGTQKLASMRRRKNPVALETMRAIKAALDPDGLLNPGKLVP